MIRSSHNNAILYYYNVVQAMMCEMGFKELLVPRSRRNNVSKTFKHHDTYLFCILVRAKKIIEGR